MWEPEHEEPLVAITTGPLPSWLSFINGELTGTPAENCGDCEIKLFGTVTPNTRGRASREGAMQVEALLRIRVAKYEEGGKPKDPGGDEVQEAEEAEEGDGEQGEGVLEPEIPVHQDTLAFNKEGVE